MISIQLNGETKTLAPDTDLSTAINTWQLSTNAFAIAINEQFIPRSNYSNTVIQHGDSIELLSPMQGG